MANSLTHSSKITAQKAKSLVRLLFVVLPVDEHVFVESNDERSEYSSEEGSDDIVVVVDDELFGCAKQKKKNTFSFG